MLQLCSSSSTRIYRRHRLAGNPTDMPTGLASLPGDLLFEVSKFLDFKADVLSLASSVSIPLAWKKSVSSYIPPGQASLFRLASRPL